MTTKVTNSNAPFSIFSRLAFHHWLFPFNASEKFQFATKVALSLTLAFLIPMALGWPQGSTAATTVMLIASTGSRRESLAKGTMRVLGTVIGAVIGLLLVGAFAQDRFLYMLSVSIVIALVFYARNAYKHDPTLFMLTGVVILSMSNGGDANGAFLYGIDRAFMTSFGVVIYTLVGTFLFPTKTDLNLNQLTTNLAKIQTQLFEKVIAVHTTPVVMEQISEQENDEKPDLTETPEPTIPELIKSLYAAQEALTARYASLSGECSDISAYKKEWDLAIYYYQQISQFLIFAAQNKGSQSLDFKTLTNNHQTVIDNIRALFKQLDELSKGKQASEHFAQIKLSFNSDALSQANHLEKGNLYSLGYLLNQLQQKLVRLNKTVDCIDSVTDKVNFKENLPKKPGRFLWWDAENAKTAIKVFVFYWIAGLIWINFNPPGGYSFVIFSTIYMSLLSFVPIHPVLLLGLFTFGFVFAVPSYIFILPQLTHGLELGIFIFSYAFIGFYLFKGPITLMFLMGLFILGINNTMHYNFAVMMSIMTLLYLVVVMIILSYYLPFSSRPEHLYLTFKERFFRHASELLTPTVNQGTFARWKRKWHIQTMNVSAKKMMVWGTKVNATLFTQAQPSILLPFNGACNALNNQINTYLTVVAQLQTNSLVQQAQQTLEPEILGKMAHYLSLPFEKVTKNQDSIDTSFATFDVEHTQAETALEAFFSQLDLNTYTQQDIAGFYIYLNLNKNIYQAMNQCKALYKDIHWASLRQKRF